MRIAGNWWVCNDGATRPTIHAQVIGANGVKVSERFLVDSCADRTVFSADLLGNLGLPLQPPTLGMSLQGISGQSPFVELTTAIEFLCDDGTPVRVTGAFAAFTDVAATDLSILGRDVLNNFDLIISRRRNEVLLLAPNHHYQIIGS